MTEKLRCPDCGGSMERVEFPGLSGPIDICLGKCADEHAAREEAEKIEREREEKDRLYSQRQRSYDHLFNDEFYGIEFKGESFDRIERTEKNVEVIESFQKYLANIEFHHSRGSAIALFGSTGIAKTKMLCAFSQALRPLRYTYIILTFKEFFDVTQWDVGKEQKRQMIDALTTCDFLLLDDVGRGHFTQPRNENLFYIVDYRWKWRRPIFFTTNYEKPEDLTAYIGDMGIMDRLLENVKEGRQVRVFGIQDVSYRRRA